jgi:hypothetical protein
MQVVSTASNSAFIAPYVTQGMRCHQLLAHQPDALLLGICSPLDDQPPTYGLCVFDPSCGALPAACWACWACCCMSRAATCSGRLSLCMCCVLCVYVCVWGGGGGGLTVGGGLCAGWEARR